MGSFSVTNVLKEARRRRVFRVVGLYIVGAWVVVQIALAIFPAFGIPETAIRYVWIGAAIGLPIALFLGWRYDIRGGRIVRTSSSNAGPVLPVGRIDIAILSALSIVVVIVISGLFGEVTGTRAPVESAQLSPVVTPNSIAVLPFENDSMAEENAEFFASGMHDELLNRLADLSALKVISRTSVMAYVETNKQARQIGEELGVVYLLEGRVQRAGDRLRIILQLIDSRTDDHVWQNEYDRELSAENIFALQAEMATSVATELHQTISPAMTSRLAERPTDSTRAYDFYLSGEEYLRRRQPDVALQQFRRAVEEDPTFSIAWAALSRAHSRAYWSGFDRVNGRHIENARDAAATAFALAPGLPEAHFAMGYFHMYATREHAKSLAQLAIAERDIPGSSSLQVTKAEVQRRSGDLTAAIATTARAIELDPRNIRLLQQQAVNYADAQDGTQFHRHLDRILEIEPDNIAVPQLRLRFGLRLGEDLADLRSAAVVRESSTVIDGVWFTNHWYLALFERNLDEVIRFLEEIPVADDETEFQSFLFAISYHLAGRPDKAIPRLETLKVQLEKGADDPNYPEHRSRRLMRLATVVAALGDFAEAERLANEAIAMRFPNEPLITKSFLHNAVVSVFIPAGIYDRAIELLEEYFSTPTGWTFEGMSRDPRLDPIRDHPGWLALVEKYKRD